MSKRWRRRKIKKKMRRRRRRRERGREETNNPGKRKKCKVKVKHMEYFILLEAVYIFLASWRTHQVRWCNEFESKTHWHLLWISSGLESHWPWVSISDWERERGKQRVAGLFKVRNVNSRRGRKKVEITCWYKRRERKRYLVDARERRNILSSASQRT